MSKKAAILTFHRARNIGTCLQAYALQEYLEEQDLCVEFIDYRPKYIEESFGIFVKALYKEARKNWKTLLVFFLKTFIKIPFNYEREKAFSNFRKEYLNIASEKFDSRDELKKNKVDYDYYFFGSDQIWNPDLTNGLDLSYFGDFVNKGGRKISYAASIGKNELSNEEINRLTNALKYLDVIGVREMSAAKLLQNYVTQKVAVNVDPTLLIDSKKWQGFIKENKYNERYILVYVLEINHELINLVRKIAEEKDLKVIFLDMKNYYGRRGISRYSAGPVEFLNLLYYAEYVVTNSFHGTVFSVIFEKQFFSVPHKSRSTRVVDLLSSLEIPERVVYFYDKVTDIDAPIDYEKVKNKLKELRADSECFIKESLKK